MKLQSIIITLLMITLVSAVQVGNPGTNGVNFQYDKPINYSLIPTVNNTYHFGGYDVSSLYNYYKSLLDLIYQPIGNYLTTINNTNINVLTINSTSQTINGNLSVIGKTNVSYNHFYFTPVQVPTGNPVCTATLTAGGTLLDDTYRYFITYVTSTGETGFSYYASNSVTTSGTNNAITLTGIPTGSTSGVTYIQRKIYRVKSSSYWAYYLATINNNVDTTYIDDGSVATSGYAKTPTNVGLSDTTSGIIYKGTKKAFEVGLNTAVGEGSLNSGTSDTTDNTAIGYNALYKLSAGRWNIGIGSLALYNNVNQESNIGIGHQSYYVLTSGTSNTGTGLYSGANLQTGSGNSIFGTRSFSPQTGSYNTVLGSFAFGDTGYVKTWTNVNYNTVVGYSAGAGVISNVENNIFLGSYAGKYENESKKLIIDSLDRSSKDNGRNSSIIYGEMNADVTKQNLTINAVVKLPVITQPTCGSSYNGSIIRNKTNKLIYCDGVNWNALY